MEGRITVAGMRARICVLSSVPSRYILVPLVNRTRTHSSYRHCVTLHGMRTGWCGGKRGAPAEVRIIYPRTQRILHDRLARPDLHEAHVCRREASRDQSALTIADACPGMVISVFHCTAEGQEHPRVRCYLRAAGAPVCFQCSSPPDGKSIAGAWYQVVLPEPTSLPRPERDVNGEVGALPGAVTGTGSFSLAPCHSPPDSGTFCLCRLVRRPRPQPARRRGGWQAGLCLIGLVALATSSAEAVDAGPLCPARLFCFVVLFKESKGPQIGLYHRISSFPPLFAANAGHGYLPLGTLDAGRAPLVSKGATSIYSSTPRQLGHSYCSSSASQSRSRISVRQSQVATDPTALGKPITPTALHTHSESAASVQSLGPVSSQFDHLLSRASSIEQRASSSDFLEHELLSRLDRSFRPKLRRHQSLLRPLSTAVASSFFLKLWPITPNRVGRELDYLPEEPGRPALIQDQYYLPAFTRSHLNVPFHCLLEPKYPLHRSLPTSLARTAADTFGAYRERASTNRNPNGIVKLQIPRHRSSAGPDPYLSSNYLGPLRHQTVRKSQRSRNRV
ncbi:hypothetical protein B0J14DRAFT_557712 [Halenospora varia]|nr:hypothetical protein B0J14DRAFT_557712 [Halenospora varia]